jgi:hypothetical protein
VPHHTSDGPAADAILGDGRVQTPLVFTGVRQKLMQVLLLTLALLVIFPPRLSTQCREYASNYHDEFSQRGTPPSVDGAQEAPLWHGLAG